MQLSWDKINLFFIDYRGSNLTLCLNVQPLYDNRSTPCLQGCLRYEYTLDILQTVPRLSVFCWVLTFGTLSDMAVRMRLRCSLGFTVPAIRT